MSRETCRSHQLSYGLGDNCWTRLNWRASLNQSSSCAAACMAAAYQPNHWRFTMTRYIANALGHNNQPFLSSVVAMFAAIGSGHNAQAVDQILQVNDAT